ncbi:hypothetical protein ULF88_25130 [Halopseudomonas pachastrellae]|nr:hypothetical protein [Halopseudomonas pachastrellae]
MTGALQQAEQHTRTSPSACSACRKTSARSWPTRCTTIWASPHRHPRPDLYVAAQSQCLAEQIEQLSEQLIGSCDGLQQGFRRLVRDLHHGGAATPWA